MWNIGTSNTFKVDLVALCEQTCDRPRAMTAAWRPALESVCIDYSPSQKQQPVLANIDRLTDDFTLVLFGNVKIVPAPSQ